MILMTRKDSGKWKWDNYEFMTNVEENLKWFLLRVPVASDEQMETDQTFRIQHNIYCFKLVMLRPKNAFSLFSQMILVNTVMGLGW